MSTRDLRDTQCSYCFLWTHRLTDGTVKIFCDDSCKRRYLIREGQLLPVSYRELDEGEHVWTGDIYQYEHETQPHPARRLQVDYLEDANGERLYRYSRSWNIRILRPTYPPLIDICGIATTK